MKAPLGVVLAGGLARRMGGGDKARLQIAGRTILERVLDEISFEAPELKKKNEKIDGSYVAKQLAEIAKNQDLSRYIL